MDPERALYMRSAHFFRQQFTMLTVWGTTKRSARFYGENAGQNDQANQELQELLPEFPHTPHPLCREWLTAAM